MPRVRHSESGPMAAGVARFTLLEVIIAVTLLLLVFAVLFYQSERAQRWQQLHRTVSVSAETSMVIFVRSSRTPSSLISSEIRSRSSRTLNFFSELTAPVRNEDISSARDSSV